MEYSYCNLILGKIYHFDPVCPFYTLHAKCFLNCVSTVTESPVAAIVSTYPRACFASFSRSVPIDQRKKKLNDVKPEELKANSIESIVSIYK